MTVLKLVGAVGIEPTSNQIKGLVLRQYELRPCYLVAGLGIEPSVIQLMRLARHLFSIPALICVNIISIFKALSKTIFNLTTKCFQS